MKLLPEKILDLLRNRLFVFFAVTVVLLMVITARLYSLQIVNGAEISESFTSSITQTLTIPASRGNIYDRYGKPLAVNEAAFSVKIDGSVKMTLSNRNTVLNTVYEHLKELNSPVEDTLPITENAPRSFTLEGNDLTKWLGGIGLSKKQIKNMNADDVYAKNTKLRAICLRMTPEK